MRAVKPVHYTQYEILTCYLLDPLNQSKYIIPTNCNDVYSMNYCLNIEKWFVLYPHGLSTLQG